LVTFAPEAKVTNKKPVLEAQKHESQYKIASFLAMTGLSDKSLRLLRSSQ
jgi:hypothetical protein